MRLGRLDCALLSASPAWYEWFLRSVEGDTNSAYDDFQSLSSLWLLSAYELVRTLCQPLGTSASREPLQLVAVKQRLASVRIPLAKLEPASSFRKRGLSRPTRVTSVDDGLGFEVEGGHIEYRNALADSLLEALEQFDPSTYASVDRAAS